MVAKFVPESTPEPVHRQPERVQGQPESGKESDEVTEILAVKHRKVI